jgi:LPS export ABC transporter protein LptC
MSLMACACSDPGRPPTSSTLPDSADQIAYGFAKYITVEGVERVHLEADSAFHYPEQKLWQLHELTVTFRSVNGQVRSTLTAKLGTYNWQTGDMIARDSVVAVTPDGRRLTTCEIQYDERSDEITGPCYFEYEGPGQRSTGDSFVGDPDFNDVTITGAAGTEREPGRSR